MAVNDLQIKSFDFAADVAKQLITLATAIITVMITFSKDILGTNSHYIAWLLSSWILFLLSIVFGIFTLMALTGVLAQSQKLRILKIGRSWRILIIVVYTNAMYAGLKAYKFSYL